MQTGLKFDENKPQYATYYPDMSDAIEGFTAVASYGAKKYGESQTTPNWSILSEAIPRLKNSLMRHVHKYLTGEMYDNESGEKHLSHIIWNAGILLKLENRGGIENARAR